MKLGWRGRGLGAVLRWKQGDDKAGWAEKHGKLDVGERPVSQVCWELGRRGERGIRTCEVRNRRLYAVRVWGRLDCRVCQSVGMG